MAVHRCPICNIPMTESEERTGRCPVCRAHLTAPAEVRNDSAFGIGSPTSPAAASRAPLGTLALFGILFVAGVLGAIVDAAIHDFRSGTGTTGVIAGIGLAYGVLHGRNLIARKA